MGEYEIVYVILEPEVQSQHLEGPDSDRCPPIEIALSKACCALVFHIFLLYLFRPEKTMS